MTEHHDDIHNLIRSYLDGLYHCDIQMLASVLHPLAVYATAAGDQPVVLSRDAYLPLVAQRDPPARTLAPRKEHILSIDVVGPATAMIKLTCRFFQKDYVDLLTLIRVDGQWQIIAKVFHYDPVP